MDQSIFISIVIPAYKSKKTLKPLYEIISSTFDNEIYEIIMVDDYSNDGTWDVIENLSKLDFRVRGIKLSRNYGQHSATICGIVNSKGKWVGTIDDDLEQSPEDLRKLLSKALEGYDLVYGKYKRKTHSKWRILSSSLMKKILKLSIPSFNGWSSIRIIRGSLAREIAVFNTSTPFVDGYLSWIIKNFTVVEINQLNRLYGKSNYNFKALMKLAINFFLEFSNRPLRIIGVIGLIISMLGLFLFIFIIIAKLTGLIMAIGYASIMSAVLFIGGIQFLILSILGEYIGFINSKASNKPIYTISIDTNE